MNFVTFTMRKRSLSKLCRRWPRLPQTINCAKHSKNTCGRTSEHVSRLEQIFDRLDEKPSGKKCLGMEGLVKEGAETMREDYAQAVMDAAIIGAAQRVEHYEMAGYGTVRALAELLGENEHVSLLEQTLEEEKQADKKLTELSQDINPKASQGGGRSPAASPKGRRTSTTKRAA